MEAADEEPFPVIYVDSKTEGEVSRSKGCGEAGDHEVGVVKTDGVWMWCIQGVGRHALSCLRCMQRWAEVSQSQLKKNKKLWQASKRKLQKNRERLEEDAKKREENLEKAKSVVIEQDPSLPPATKVRHWLWVLVVMEMRVCMCVCCTDCADQDQTR